MHCVSSYSPLLLAAQFGNVEVFSILLVAYRDTQWVYGHTGLFTYKLRWLDSAARAEVGPPKPGTPAAVAAAERAAAAEARANAANNAKATGGGNVTMLQRLVQKIKQQPSSSQSATATRKTSFTGIVGGGVGGWDDDDDDSSFCCGSCSRSVFGSQGRSAGGRGGGAAAAAVVMHALKKKKKGRRVDQHVTKSALSEAVYHDHVHMLRHPVLQRIVNEKWEAFGRRHAVMHSLFVRGGAGRGVRGRATG
jgi:hypothetical protein